MTDLTEGNDTKDALKQKMATNMKLDKHFNISKLADASDYQTTS